MQEILKQVDTSAFQEDDVLLALRTAGLGSETLKAVLTPTNAAWEPVQLYKELQRERDEFRKMNK